MADSVLDFGPGILDARGFTSHSAFEDHYLRIANFLISRGVKAGDSVALLMRNCSPFIEATAAVQHLGAYPVPLNWHLMPAEISYVLEDCEARLLIADADLLAPLTDLPPHLELVSIDADRMIWKELLAAHHPIRTAPAAAVQSMIYTSGTTGKPKGVRRQPPAPPEAETIRQMRSDLYGLRANMRGLLAAPMYHSAPNFFALSIVRGGGLLVLQSHFDARQTLDAIERFGISHSFMVPTMFVRLLALSEAERCRYDLSTLQHVLHAGAPCPADIKSAMIDWWGPVLFEYYGSTEMGPLTFCTSADSRAKPGTVGKPLQGIELTIRDEQGSRCAAGVAGDIFVATTIQPDFTYHRAPEKREEVSHGDEMITGDIGYQDDDGYLFICGRRTDMIISGGTNIYPAEIESALHSISGIMDCAVFGLPDEEFGESVFAAIQLEQGCSLTEEQILKELELKIAKYKLPRKMKFYESLPRDESGKIYKRRLRETFI